MIHEQNEKLSKEKKPLKKLILCQIVINHFRIGGISKREGKH